LFNKKRRTDDQRGAFYDMACEEISACRQTRAGREKMA
jgi:hypothetical protein